MIRTAIRAGIRGFNTAVAASSADLQHVSMAIESTCKRIRGLAAELATAIDAFREIGDGFEGVILKTVRRHLKGCCAGCIVPRELDQEPEGEAGQR
jgi:hypothetical protein